jgi:integrase
MPYVSTELVRLLRKDPPARVTDYRDPKVPGFVLRARPTGVHTWRVQLADRTWRSLGRVDEVTIADARDAAQKTRARAKLGEVPVAPKSSDALTLATFLDAHYEPWIRATRPRTKQAGRIKAAFRDLLELSLTELTTARVERWRVDRQYRKRAPVGVVRRLSPVTVNRDVASLQAALQRAIEWGHLQTNPIRLVKRSTEDGAGVIRYLTKAEEQRLRDALAARDDERRARRVRADAWRRERGHNEWGPLGDYTDHVTPAVLLALNTGLRRGEILQLRWRDVSLERRMLTVRGEGAKSGQTRHVPLNSEAAQVLKTWAADGTSGPGVAVFAGETPETPLTDIKKAWGALVGRAQLVAFRFHDLRHTFASKLAMAGVDLNTVRELLGHSDISMTLRYAHLAPEHKANAVERLVRA